MNDPPMRSLVVAMYGGLDNGPNFESYTRLSAKACKEEFIAVYPEGVEHPIFDNRAWIAENCCGRVKGTFFEEHLNCIASRSMEEYRNPFNELTIFPFPLKILFL